MKLKSKDKNIWFTSDTHYNHSNICYATSAWNDKEKTTRKFSSLDKMNDDIVNNINSLIMPDDILFHLGDWSMGGYNNIWKFRNRLNVKEIHLIASNHDEHIKRDKLFQIDDVSNLDANHMTKFEDESELLKFEVSAKDSFTSVSDYMEIKIDGINIMLCHYPIVSWNHKHKDSWHLHGHTHNNLFNEESINHWYNTSKILDVGLDTAYMLYGSYIPLSLRQIKTFMTEREFIQIDRHNESTN